MGKISKKEQILSILIDAKKTGAMIVTERKVGDQKMCKHKLIGPQYIGYFIERLKYHYNSNLETSKQYVDKYGKENAHKIIWAELTSKQTQVRDASHYNCDFNAKEDDLLIRSGKLQQILHNNEVIEKLDKANGGN